MFLRAEDLGVRLELVRGLPIWEAHPVWRHQKSVDRIRQSIAPGDASFAEGPTSLRAGSQDNKPCACVHVADVYIAFADGSLKRPDIAIFCREPDELDDAITLVPEAVVEVVSKGYEAKDLEIAPGFYLSQGVKDVLVFDPHSLLVLHARTDGTERLTSPVERTLQCGCTLTV